MKIRNATQTDIDLLTKIIRISFRDVAVRFGLTLENCPKHPSNCTAQWIQKDLEKGVFYYILENEDETIGCVALEMAEKDLAYLERLAVLPQKRKQGLGRTLVDYVLNQANQSGAKNISIGIIAAQDELKKWYKKIGFVERETKEFAHLPFLVTFMNRTLEKNSGIL